VRFLENSRLNMIARSDSLNASLSRRREQYA
jgi:hypothetical protein